MIREVNRNDDFATSLLEGVSEPETVPQAFYNKDGDCIEFLISNESYYAERVDDLLTVYHSQESDDIVGSLVKGVSTFVRHVLQASPGFAIEIQDGEMCLTHLFTAGMWQSGDDVRVQAYKRLRDSAGEHHVSVHGLPEFV